MQHRRALGENYALWGKAASPRRKLRALRETARILKEFYAPGGPPSVLCGQKMVFLTKICSFVRFPLCYPPSKRTAASRQAARP